jgi:hypothetical protein
LIVERQAASEMQITNLHEFARIFTNKNSFVLLLVEICASRKENSNRRAAEIAEGNAEKSNIRSRRFPRRLGVSAVALACGHAALGGFVQIRVDS